MFRVPWKFHFSVVEIRIFSTPTPYTHHISKTVECVPKKNSIHEKSNLILFSVSITLSLSSSLSHLIRRYESSQLLLVIMTNKTGSIDINSQRETKRQTQQLEIEKRSEWYKIILITNRCFSHYIYMHICCVVFIERFRKKYPSLFTEQFCLCVCMCGWEECDRTLKSS